MIARENINQAVASVLIEALHRLGVRDIVISPGSRSTPLTVAFARHDGLRKKVHFDERGAAFYALGLSKATGRPTALVCTSGTAAANYLPAVIEASMDRVPLVILTADRPPELQDCGANQTIQQPGLYGTYVVAQAELPCPDPTTDPALLVTTVTGVVRSAVAESAPVHFNCPFREPLVPVEDGSVSVGFVESAEAALHQIEFENPAPSDSHIPSAEFPPELLSRFSDSEELIIVAGKLESVDERVAVEQIADHLKCPLLPDIQSGLRMTGSSGTRIPHYDLLLCSESLREHIQPETVLHLGGRVTSKRLLQWLGESQQAIYAIVGDQSGKFDPNHQVTHRLSNPVTELAAALTSRAGRPKPTRFAQVLSQAETDIQPVLKDLDSQDELTEPGIAWWLSSSTAKEAECRNRPSLYLSSSLPVRTFDSYGNGRSGFSDVQANRGASGIDGIIASACGYAEGTGRPTTLVIGDLAFLHDLNSLALLAKCTVRVTVVLLNNNGGNIFSMLPVAEHTDVFEEYFLTPHGYTLENAARQFDCDYLQCRTLAECERAYDWASRSGTSTVVELMIDREVSNRSLRLAQDRIVQILDTI